jgi:hypothetical protein
VAVLEASIRRSARRRRRRRPWRAVAAVALLLALAAGLLAGRAGLHGGEAMPGVRVLGTEVAGVPRSELGATVRGVVARRLAEPVPLRVAGRTVEIAPAKLFMLDREATVADALDAGRDSWGGRASSLLSPATDGIDVSPRLVVRPNADERLVALLKPFATPPVDARVGMRGTEAVVFESKPGTSPDL